MRSLFVGCLFVVVTGAHAAGDAPIEERKNIVYAEVDGQPLHLDAYLLEGSRNPLVIYVHGGGFTGGAKEALRTGWKEISDQLFATGFSQITINYRLAPKHPFPAATDDTKAAVAWIRRHADELRIDPDRMALMGDSAGGMIVSHAGATATADSRVAAVASFFGEHDFALRVSENPCAADGKTFPRPEGGCISGGMAAFLGFAELKTDAQRRVLAEATVVNHVHRQMPKYLLFHGTRDYGVPIEQSHSMQQAMRRVGADCEMVAVVGGGHGHGGWTKPHQLHYKRKLLTWLVETLSK